MTVDLSSVNELPINIVAHCPSCGKSMITVIERWFLDGRGIRKIGDGPWEPIENLHGRTPFMTLEQQLTPQNFGGPTMQPHQERVVTEKAELDSKIEKLDTFLHGSIYQTLTDEERMRLMRQFCHMKDYSNVLGERIAAF